VLDIYVTSIDDAAEADRTRKFFATVQKKMHWAAHGNTAADVIHQRVNADQPLMGLQTTRPGGLQRSP